jgi:small-conductance mechanosensitive channel
VREFLGNDLIYHLVVGAAIVVAFALLSCLLDLATAHPDILKDPAPQVSIAALSESAVQYTLTALASSFATHYATETALRERAYMAFRHESIAVPVPRQIVTVQQEGGPAR